MISKRSVFMNNTTVQSEATVIHVRVDRSVKNDADRLFKELGMSMSAAINMFFKQALAEQALPFHPKVKQKALHKPNKTLGERLKDFTGTYEYSENDTGGAVGCEVIDDIYS